MNTIEKRIKDDKLYDDKTSYFDKIIKKIKSLDIPNKIYSSDYCTINENIEKILRDKNIIDENNVQHIVGKDFKNGKITLKEYNLDEFQECSYLYGCNKEFEFDLLTQDEFKEYFAKTITNEELYAYNYGDLYWKINSNRNMLLALDDVDMSVEDNYCLQTLFDTDVTNQTVDEIMEYTKKEIKDLFERSVWYIVEEKYGKRNEDNLVKFYNNITKEDLKNLSYKFKNQCDLTNPCVELQERLNIKLKYNITKDDIDLSLVSDYFKKENIEEKKQEEKQEETTKKTKKILKL